MPAVYIGCSGFNYTGWKSTFYPDHLPQKKWLEYYCTIFSTVELNVTFYRLPLLKTFEKWHEETPRGFSFSLKGSRFITHIKKLLDPEEPLALFSERSSPLQEKLKVVLWQFPPGFAINMERLERFVELLGRYPARNTLEFRNQSWMTEKVLNLCRTHNICLCMADWPPFINELPVTSDFVYIRRHGLEGDYATSYPETALTKDAASIKRYMADGKDVYVYFNNDAHGYAPRNAGELKKMIKDLQEDELHV
ncbi:MAG: hypothetical protein A4E65_00716 [Syntrophorhabdus sp. PtaU1.Bin153]|nr:MAG: hypothetical protein A4E65_00716 [Syntrophorhabdus sp. PtaU1.Bin153]